jgi:hypothetical protein
MFSDEGGSMRVLPLSFACTILVACGSSAPPEARGPASDDSAPRGPSGGGLSIESEIGALNEEQVVETFQNASGELSRCFAQGAQRIPYLAGLVRFEIRVGPSGRARAVMLKDSSLGDLETESCMIEVLERAAWPSPEGGREGIAENEFVFDAGGAARPPVDWSEGELGEELETAKPDLAECRAGTGPLKATMYVETDGSPKSAGASFSDENGREAARCLVDKLLSMTFPSPGSYASKVSFVID